MKFGLGHPPRILEIGESREVSVDEFKFTERDKRPALARIRDHHHSIARMAAVGMKPSEIVAQTGMSFRRVNTLLYDTAFRELIEHYRSLVDDEWKKNVAGGIYALMSENHATALRIQNRQLTEIEDNDEKVPLGTLTRVIADLSDRVGFGKHSVVSVDNSFSARLDRAIERSGIKTIEGKTETVANPPDRQLPARDSALAGGPRVEARRSLPSAEIERRRA